MILVDQLLAARLANQSKDSDNRIVHRRNKVISISIGRPSWFISSEYIVTDIENEEIMPSIKGNDQREVMNDLLKLLDLVQKHADILQSGCLDSLTLEYQKRCPPTAKINNMISLGFIRIAFLTD